MPTIYFVWPFANDYAVLYFNLVCSTISNSLREDRWNLSDWWVRNNKKFWSVCNNKKHWCVRNNTKQEVRHQFNSWHINTRAILLSFSVLMGSSVVSVTSIASKISKAAKNVKKKVQSIVKSVSSSKCDHSFRLHCD